MRAKIYKTKEAFNKAIREAEREYSYSLRSEIDSTSTVFWGNNHYEDTGEIIESWTGKTTAVYFDDEQLETLILVLL